MNPKITELLAKAEVAYKSGLAVETAAKTAGRDINAEELAKIEQFFNEAIALKGEGDRLHKLSESAALLAKDFDKADYKFAFGGDTAQDVPKDIQLKHFDAFLRAKGNVQALSPDAQKTLTRLSAVDGGFWVPEEFSSQLITKLDALLFMRRIATVMRTNAASLNMPSGSLAITVSKRYDNKAITPLTITGAAGNVQFTPHWFDAILKCPNELLLDAIFDLRGYITDRMARGVAQGEETEFMAGTGVGGPIGLLQSGLTAVDIATATSDTIIGADIWGLPYSLEAQYRGGAAWLMPRYVMKKVALLRDESGGAGLGLFLWQPDFTAPGAPARLAGFPVYETEYGFTAAASTADGDALLIFGDFRRGYTIIDRAEMTIQVLDQLYAEANQVGYKVSFAVDGKVIDINALVRLNRT